MIIGLTIFLMILFIWIIYSSIVVMDEGSLIWYCEDTIIIKICKAYWLIVLIIIGLSLLFGACYVVSREIVCNSKNNDYPQCENRR